MSNLRISELDFDQIKSNLKTYLSSQTEFSDYDFEGSGLSVLLDILAYNTHYNAYLANMVVNEMFLDSAVKRSSAVSIAKHLGYTPRSVQGSTAYVDITVLNPTGSPSSLTLDRYNSFSSSVNGTVYNFLNTDSITIQPVDGVYKFSNVPIKEGRLLQYSYNVVSPGPSEKYEIPNSLVDTSSILVSVQNSSTDTTTTIYSQANGLIDYDSTSTVYFIEENPMGNYQLYFGDGIIGKKLVPGNIITIQYLVCGGTAANVSGAITQTFVADNTIGGSSNIIITTIANSTGGADRESISSIKFNAPRANLNKNRAVTKNDYSSLIKAQYTQIESISVWGGEENTPPAYGKVFISLKPYSGYTINENVKNEIKNVILKERQMLTVIPEFIDPDYIFVNLNVDIKFNKNSTTLNSSQISSLARTAISDYFTNNLQHFEKPFYYSQLLENINNINTSVLSVIVSVSVQKRITPVLNVSNAYISENTIKFNNKLHPGHLQSTKFFISRNGIILTVRIKDIPNDTTPAGYNGKGDVRLYDVNDNLDLGSIGTIDYANGTITITNITPVGYPAGQYDIYITTEAQEDSYDITADKNQIIVLDDSTESAVSSRLPGITINVTSV